MHNGESHGGSFPWRLLVMTIAVLCAVFFLGEILLTSDSDSTQLATTDYNRANKVGPKITTRSHSLAYAPKHPKKNKLDDGKKPGRDKLKALLAKKGITRALDDSIEKGTHKGLNKGINKGINKGLGKGINKPNKSQISSINVKDILKHVDLKAPPFVPDKFSWELSNRNTSIDEHDGAGFTDDQDGGDGSVHDGLKSLKQLKQKKSHGSKATHGSLRLNKLDEKGRQMHRVILVKTHKTASTTLASMLIRMAELRGLRIYLPPEGSVDAIRTVNPLKLPKPPNTGKLYDMWLLHTQFHPMALQRFVPGGLFLTSVRDSAERFVSGWFHLRGPQRSGCSSIEDYVRRAEAYIAKKEPLPPQLEQLRNSLAKELLPYPPGKELSASDPAFQALLRDITDLSKPMIPKPVQTLGKTIKVIDPPEDDEEDDDKAVGAGGSESDKKKKKKATSESDLVEIDGQLRVILTESFDEGVLAMAHDWNWSLNDVLYLSQNNGTGTHYPKDPSLDPRSNVKLMDKLRALNPLDQLVVDAARKAHELRLKSLPSNWKADLKALQDSNKKFQEYCGRYPNSKDCIVSKLNQSLWLKIYRLLHPDNTMKPDNGIAKSQVRKKAFKNI